MAAMKRPATSTNRMKMRHALLAGVLALALGACEQSVQVRGNIPDAEVVTKINPGVHSRTDIASLLGSPSTVSTFQDSKWYYIGQKTTQFAFFEQEVLERKVLVVSFDDSGYVAETRTYGIEDGRVVDLVERETPTEGRELSLIQQLLGNLGRFSAK
jgi:outer membrane protein assembly factor BamE (lipoprotein component of BamABCDE complex)